MIGNKYLQELFAYPDKDTSINQLLELLKSKDLIKKRYRGFWTGEMIQKRAGKQDLIKNNINNFNYVENFPL